MGGAYVLYRLIKAVRFEMGKEGLRVWAETVHFEGEDLNVSFGNKGKVWRAITLRSDVRLR